MPGVTLDRLKSVICQLKDKLNEYDVKFSCPLRNSDLITFENENTVRLPEDYRLFLTIVGNGGSSGPCREGLLPLGKVPTLLSDKRSRVLRGLPDHFPFSEPSIITCRPVNDGLSQQSLSINNSNSEQDNDENSETGTFDDMDLDGSRENESQDEDNTGASDSSDNGDDADDGDGDDMDGYGLGNSGGGSSSSTNDEDNDDKYFPSTRTLFQDIFQLYHYPPFSVQRHDIHTLNNSADSRINDGISDMTIPMVGGYLILGTTEHSRHYFWILIVSGTNRGEVWIMNTNGFYFPTNTKMQFHQWIDDWISGSDKINATVWTCGLYDLQLRVSSRYRNRNSIYTSIYDSSISSDDDQEDDGDTDTECSYDDDTDSFDDGDNLTV